MDNLSGQGYEIIIDYKGMRRPPSSDDEWQQHEWQILTYSWLRSKQPGSKPQVAGILFYLNELRPSGQDISELRSEILNNSTDILPSGDDRRLIEQWRPSMPIPELSSVFREERSIRIIPINEINVPHSVKQFDDTVSAIENSVMRESHGTGLNQSWPARPVLRTCTACDFKIFCPASGKVGKFQPTVP